MFLSHQPYNMAPNNTPRIHSILIEKGPEYKDVTHLDRHT